MLNPGLVQYVESEIVPRYASFDKAHREDHVRKVIEEAMNMSVHYDVDKDVLYAAAAFHDTGLVDGREVHHMSSGRIIREDPHLKEWFTPDKIETIAQAAEDHRASSGCEPRSIYGKIVAEADRDIEPMRILRRTVQFGMEHYPELDKEGHWKRMLEHLAEKYDYGGYLKLYIPESSNAVGLQALRDIIHDPERLRSIFERFYEEERLDTHVPPIASILKNRLARNPDQSYSCKTNCRLELRTSLYKSLAGPVGLVLLEVLDEPCGEILCLLLPL